MSISQLNEFAPERAKSIQRSFRNFKEYAHNGDW
jgi:hypothetical protein